MKNNDIDIIFYCLFCLEFCQMASKTMTANPLHDDAIRKTCEGLSKIFSSLGNDFEKIAKMTGFKIDLTTEKGKIILEKITDLSKLEKKPQRKKLKKEISALLSSSK